MDVVRDIKEKLCWCSLDYEADIEKFKTGGAVSYKLPDDETIMVGS